MTGPTSFLFMEAVIPAASSHTTRKERTAAYCKAIAMESLHIHEIYSVLVLLRYKYKLSQVAMSLNYYRDVAFPLQILVEPNEALIRCNS